jgi:hypothetical protein
VKTSCAAKLEFQCTNNVVENKALLLGLTNLKVVGIKRAILKFDS